MPRVIIDLLRNESELIRDLAIQEKRTMQQQTSWLVREALQKRGLLKTQRVIKPVNAGQEVQHVG